MLEELFSIIGGMEIKPNDKFFNKIIDFTAKNNNI